MITRRDALLHGTAFVGATLVGAALGTLTVSSAVAQNYPSRPVKMIVPFAPGGIDVVAACRGSAQHHARAAIRGREPSGRSWRIGRRQSGRIGGARWLHTPVQLARARTSAGHQPQRRLRHHELCRGGARVQQSIVLMTNPRCR